MTTPAWSAPAPGGDTKAGQINQFHGTHAARVAYDGAALVTGQMTAASAVDSNTGAAAQWIAQPFTTAGGQTTIDRLDLKIAAVGTAADVTITLQTDAAGVPSGVSPVDSPSVVVPADFFPGSAAVVSIPFPCSGLTAATKYHIVISGTASTSNYDAFKAGAVTGSAALVSPSGAVGTWSADTHTLYFVVYAGTAGLVRHTFEDVGARWVGIDWSAGLPVTVREYTGAMRSVRDVTYSGSNITAIS